MAKKPVLLCIMDGFGWVPNETYGNAVVAAKTPHLDALMAKYPMTTIEASGMAVGLPDGQMGNSEVGHTNMGAGRIVYQQLTLITKSIKDGEMLKNPVLVKNMQAAIDAAQNGAVIQILQSGLSATVSGSKSFTVELAEGVTEPALTAASGYQLTRSGNAYTVSKQSSNGSSGGGFGSSGSSYAVSAPSTKNGDVTVNSKNAKKGDTVTITVTPDKGYELDTITVKDASGNKLKLTDKGNGKYTFTMPASKVTVSAEFVEEQAASTFADVPTDAYYAKAVEWAVKNGITNGKDNGLFGSNDPCTRGQIVTFLWRAAGSPVPKGTATVPADVLPGSYSYNAVAWALENGITNGMADGTFGVNSTCTRGQSVTFLYRALGTAPSTVNGFTDVAADSFCAEAVTWAVENGVTNGTSAATFNPNNGCTRAQIVTFLYRAYQGK